jgi:hypothetical protein
MTVTPPKSRQLAALQVANAEKTIMTTGTTRVATDFVDLSKSIARPQLFCSLNRSQSQARCHSKCRGISNVWVVNDMPLFDVAGQSFPRHVLCDAIVDDNRRVKYVDIPLRYHRPTDERLIGV